jgi:tryptophan halogenase
MSAVRHVAIVGRDAPLWLASLSLQHALAPAGIAVSAVELPSQLSEHHAYAGSPSLNGLHALIGLDRRSVLRESGGIAVGGQRHVGWSEHPYFIAFDGPRPAFDGADIVQHWIAARRDGASVPLERLSLAAVALSRGKVGADGRDPSEFGAIHRGGHLDARAYSALLRSSAIERGIGHRELSSVEPVFEGTCLARIDCPDGEPIHAELYVDASGPDAVLASAQPGDDWSDWGSDLPIRKLWWASAPPLQPFPPFAELTRSAAGWSARIPLADRTAILVACAEAETSPDVAAAAGTTRVSAPVGEDFVAGCRATWRDNVVALGDAACRIEPADLMSLHLLHAGIANLIAWIPAAADETWALREHVNGVLRRQAESARDFQAARYRFGKDAGASAGGWPEALAHRAAVFAARGRVPVFDDDTFDEGLWSLQLAGLGIVPRSADPRAQRIGQDQREQQLARLVAAIDAEVARMPTVAADLAG